MIQLTKIEWCDATINFWEGCSKVSTGCANCYAEDRDKRYHDGRHWGKGAPRKWVKAGPEKARALQQMSMRGLFCHDHLSGERGPIAGNQKGETFERDGKTIFRFHPVRPIAFCLSLGDFFDEEVSTEYRQAALRTIAASTAIDWMILTKRPEKILPLLRRAIMSISVEPEWDQTSEMLTRWLSGYPPINIALGTSVENQAVLESRVPAIQQAPAATRFLSCEPLLGALDFGEKLDGINQIITGGESGPQARPCHPAWVNDIAKQAAAAGIDHHHKQWGEWVDTEIVPPHPQWSPEQGQAIFMAKDGTVTGTGGKPPGARMLWRAGKKAAGSELLDLENGKRGHAKRLLSFPKKGLVLVED